MKYREVKRPAKIGEKIKIVNATTTREKYKNGDILTVSPRSCLYPSAAHVSEFEQPYILLSEYVVLEEIKDFALSDLEPCMVVKRRDGVLAIVANTKCDGLCFQTADRTFTSFRDYEEDIICKYNFRALDIMKVFGFSGRSSKATEISEEFREVLYERTEEPMVEEMTMEQICKELGRTVKIVKE